MTNSGTDYKAAHISCADLTGLSQGTTGQLYPQAGGWREAALPPPAGPREREFQTVAMKEPRAILRQDQPQNTCTEIKHSSGNEQGLSGVTQNLMEDPLCSILVGACLKPLDSSSKGKLPTSQAFHSLSRAILWVDQLPSPGIPQYVLFDLEPQFLVDKKTLQQDSTPVLKDRCSRIFVTT